MTIESELASELRDAMKAHDQRRMDVIRQIATEVSRAKSEPGFEGAVDDALYQSVITAYVKKMEKAKAEFEALGERGEAQAAKLGYEVEYLGRWLPETLSEEATKAFVDAAIAELKADDPRMVGRVTGHVMKTGPGGLDGALVSRMVREALGAE
jgi:hypothetical protein